MPHGLHAANPNASAGGHRYAHGPYRDASPHLHAHHSAHANHYAFALALQYSNPCRRRYA